MELRDFPCFFGLLDIKTWIDSLHLPRQGNGKEIHYNKVNRMRITCAKKTSDRLRCFECIMKEKIRRVVWFLAIRDSLYTDDTLFTDAGWESTTAWFFPTEAASSDDRGTFPVIKTMLMRPFIGEFAGTKETISAALTATEILLDIFPPCIFNSTGWSSTLCERDMKIELFSHSSFLEQLIRLIRFWKTFLWQNRNASVKIGSVEIV